MSEAVRWLNPREIAMKTFACVAVVTAALAGPAAAQVFAPASLPADRPTITVVGSGSAEREPDTFSVKAVIEETGVDRDAALRAMDTTQTRLMQGLGDMQGLTAVRLETEACSVMPVRDPACEQPYGRESACPVIGYKATMPLLIVASPVARAGDAVSLASELGAASASLEAFSLSNNRDMTSEANRAAFADAEQQARALAEASGQRILRTLRVSDANARTYGTYGLVGPEQIAVTGGRERASVPITVAPPPVRVTSSISVVFEIE